MRKTSSGLCLMLAIVSASVAWGQTDKGQIVVDGSTTVGPIAKQFKEYYQSLHPDVRIEVSESGSGNGFKSLLNGTCDVASMSRFVTVDEFRAAAQKGVIPVAHVVAVDGLAIVVHPANPVQNITIEQIRDIYKGKIQNWKDVGGPDLKIVKISRDTNSGTYETFEQKVMSGEKMSAETEKVGSNGQMRQRVMSTPTAIGYVGLGFLDRSVKPISVNGIHADRTTVSSGRYPIARPLFFFTNGYPEMGTHLHAFVTLHLTPKGQEYIESIGFVPVTSYAPLDQRGPEH